MVESPGERDVYTTKATIVMRRKRKLPDGARKRSSDPAARYGHVHWWFARRGVGAAVPGDVRIGGWIPGMQSSTPSIALAIGYGWGNPRVL